MSIFLTFLFLGFDLLIHRIMVIFEVRKNPNLFKDIEIPKSWKKFIPVLLFGICIFFIGNVVNAKGTMFIGNGTVLNQCTGTTCGYPIGGTTNIRFIGDSTNFEVDHKYTFKLNFSAQTSLASPTLTDCGLNINGAYVSPESRNSGRVNFECNSGYTRCDSNYVSTIIYTMPSSLTSVPYFIQCDMTPISTTYTYTNFTMSISDSNGSVIQALDNNTDRMIEINNYNANQNNKNRDTNTNKITDKIQDFMDSVGTGISNIISNLTTLGSNIVSGIGTAISNGVNALISAMDGLQMGINAVISAIGDIVSPIVTAIGNGVNSIVNKIGDLIGLNEVCETFVNIYNGAMITGPGYISGKTFNSSGELVNSNNQSVTDYIMVNESSNSTVNYKNNYQNTNTYLCKYYADKTLKNCEQIDNGNVNKNFQFGPDVMYIRFNYRSNVQGSSGGIRILVTGNCQKSGILGLFNSFTQFVRRFFDNTIGSIWEDLNNINKIQDTPVTDLILMPLSLIDALHTALNSNTCSGYTIPFDFTGGNNTLTLPCINLQNYLGSTLWSAIDLILMGLMIYSIAMMCVSFFESWSSLHDTFDFLYNVGPNKGR